MRDRDPIITERPSVSGYRKTFTMRLFCKCGTMVPVLIDDK